MPTLGTPYANQSAHQHLMITAQRLPPKIEVTRPSKPDGLVAAGLPASAVTAGCTPGTFSGFVTGTVTELTPGTGSGGRVTGFAPGTGRSGRVCSGFKGFAVLQYHLQKCYMSQFAQAPQAIKSSM